MSSPNIDAVSASPGFPATSPVQASTQSPRNLPQSFFGLVAFLALLALAAVLPFLALCNLSDARPYSAERAVYDSLREFAYSPMGDSPQMFDGETDIAVTWKRAKPAWFGTGSYDAILTLKGPLPDHVLSADELREHNTFLNEFRKRHLTSVTLTKTVHVTREGLEWKVTGLPSASEFFSEQERAFLTKGEVNGVAFKSADGVFNGHDGYYSVIRYENGMMAGVARLLFLMLCLLCAAVVWDKLGPVAGYPAVFFAFSCFLAAWACEPTFLGAMSLSGMTFG